MSGGGGWRTEHVVRQQGLVCVIQDVRLRVDEAHLFMADVNTELREGEGLRRLSQSTMSVSISLRIHTERSSFSDSSINNPVRVPRTSASLRPSPTWDAHVYVVHLERKSKLYVFVESSSTTTSQTETEQLKKSKVKKLENTNVKQTTNKNISL